MMALAMAPPKRIRDRPRTETRILDALGAILLDDGFGALGINAVAARAGVDKVLIYRYFGGLDGLLAAFARHADLWWSVDELVGDHLPPPDDDSFAGWIALILRRHVAELSARPLARAVIAWEVVARNPLTEAVARLRAERSFAVMAAVVARAGPGGARAGPIVAALSAALEHLLLRGATFDDWLGLDLASEAGWRRIEAAIGDITRAAFAR